MHRDTVFFPGIWLALDRNQSIIGFLSRRKKKWMHLNCKVVSSAWSRKWRRLFRANVLYRLAGGRKNNESFRLQFWFNISVWIQPEVGTTLTAQVISRRPSIHHLDGKEKLFCLPPSPSTHPPSHLLSPAYCPSAASCGTVWSGAPLSANGFH